MTDENKVSVTAALENLSAGGQTNLWDGLKTGLDELKSTEGYNANVLLFTDGMPNVEPPRGHLGALRDYKDKTGSLKCAINTFGFG